MTGPQRKALLNYRRLKSMSRVEWETWSPYSPGLHIQGRSLHHIRYRDSHRIGKLHGYDSQESTIGGYNKQHLILIFNSRINFPIILGYI